MMVLRFANSIFEPIWNYKYIDHVQITVSKRWASRSGAGTTTRAGPCGTWCRTTCSS